MRGVILCIMGMSTAQPFLSQASSRGSTSSLSVLEATQLQNDGKNYASEVTRKPVARWCQFLVTAGHGIDVAIDRTKIMKLDTTANNGEVVEHIHGEKVNPQIWPLLFEGDKIEDGADNSMPYLRSLAYMRSLLAENNSTSPERFKSLPGSEKRSVALGVRDLYLADWRGLLDRQDLGDGFRNEKKLLHDITNFLIEPVDLDTNSSPDDTTSTIKNRTVTIKNLPVSFHPSANYKMLRFIQDIENYIPEERKSLTPYFAQILSNPRIYAVFVDPTDLSYHNFENIILLDPWFLDEAKALLLPQTQPHNTIPSSSPPQSKQQDALPLAINNIQQLQAPQKVWTSTLSLTTNNPSLELNQLLLNLANLNLYTPPLNASTRGGERFIFHSNLLSRSLTHAIRESTLFSHLNIPPTSIKSTNYIFRLNKFHPGDNKFSCHRDTPYYDAARGHISRYTVLIYLTGGTSTSTDKKNGGDQHPILRIKTPNDDDNHDIKIHEIQPMQCIIFDQRLEHEGYPYIEGDKVFLRTELIFDVIDNPSDSSIQNEGDVVASTTAGGGGGGSAIRHDATIGELFAQACYYTSMAATSSPSGMGVDIEERQVFQNELSRHAHACYEKVNAMHWGLQDDRDRLQTEGVGSEARETSEDSQGTRTGLYLHKTFAGLNFVTNGYHYWFARETPPHEDKGGRSSCMARKGERHLKDCAVVAVLDYFNCRLGGARFRQMCQVTSIQHTIGNDDDIWEILRTTSIDEQRAQKAEARGLRRLGSADLDNLIRTKPYKPFIQRECSWMDEDDDFAEEEDMGEEAGIACCCPFHDYKNFNAWDSTDVYDDIYAPCCEYTRRKILGSPIVFLDEELVVNEKQILVEGDKIYILRDDKVRFGTDGDGREDIVQEPPYGRDVHGRINFAACWNSIPPTAFIGLDREVSAPQILVPPMQFYEIDKGEGGYYHLVLDFFANDWVVDVDGERQIPVPTIENHVAEDAEEADDHGGSDFLKRLPGIRTKFGQPMEIMSEEERRIEDEKFDARARGRRSGRRQTRQDLGEVYSQCEESGAQDDEDSNNDDDLVEIDDDEWGTESEAEATDEERDERRRRRRQEWLRIDSEVELDEEDVDNEDVGEGVGRTETSDSDVAPRKRQRQM